MTTKEIKEKLEVLVDPATNKTLGETAAIKHVGIDPEKKIVILIIAIAKTGGDEEKQLRRNSKNL